MYSQNTTKRRDWRISRKYTAHENIGDVLAEYPQTTAMQRLKCIARDGEEAPYKVKLAVDFVGIVGGHWID